MARSGTASSASAMAGGDPWWGVGAPAAGHTATASSRFVPAQSESTSVRSPVGAGSAPAPAQLMAVARGARVPDAMTSSWVAPLEGIAGLPDHAYLIGVEKLD